VAEHISISDGHIHFSVSMKLGLQSIYKFIVWKSYWIVFGSSKLAYNGHVLAKVWY